MRALLIGLLLLVPTALARPFEGDVSITSSATPVAPAAPPANELVAQSDAFAACAQLVAKEAADHPLSGFSVHCRTDCVMDNCTTTLTRPAAGWDFSGWPPVPRAQTFSNPFGSWDDAFG